MDDGYSPLTLCYKNDNYLYTYTDPELHGRSNGGIADKDIHYKSNVTYWKEKNPNDKNTITVYFNGEELLGLHGEPDGRFWQSITESIEKSAT